MYIHVKICICVCIHKYVRMCVCVCQYACTLTYTLTHACIDTDSPWHTPWKESRKMTSAASHTTAHCNTLQHTATHCNTMQHTATHCNTLQHTATHYSTLHCTATRCNTLQHAATRCNALQRTATHKTTHTYLGKRVAKWRAPSSSRLFSERSRNSSFGGSSARSASAPALSILLWLKSSVFSARHPPRIAPKARAPCAYEWNHLQHMDEWVMSHKYTCVPVIWVSLGTHVNAWWHTCGWLMAHIRIGSCVTYGRVSHVTQIYMCEWVMSHKYTCVSHMSESRHSDDTSWHTYKWLMAHI